MSVKRVLVTGAAGQIAYSLLFRIANGDLLGKEQGIILHLLDVGGTGDRLKGLLMELRDCAFPLLQDIQYGSDAEALCRDVDYAILLGAKPRSLGMERSDLLKENARIFYEQGRALNEAASPNVQVLVVGNPCNTNCWVAMTQAPRLPRKNFHAMTRLDQNRASFQLAKRAKVSISDVSRVTIWGNHSTTQVPDFHNARISGQSPDSLIEGSWLEKDFLEKVQGRGSEVIQARGKSSAASAASAVIDSLFSLTAASNIPFSSGVCSDGNTYGIAEDLIFSFPCICTAPSEYSISPDFVWNDFLIANIRASEAELLEERRLVQDVLSL